jgi:hypothetical protein
MHTSAAGAPMLRKRCLLITRGYRRGYLGPFLKFLAAVAVQFWLAASTDLKLTSFDRTTHAHIRIIMDNNRARARARLCFSTERSWYIVDPFVDHGSKGVAKECVRAPRVVTSPNTKAANTIIADLSVAKFPTDVLSR